MRGISRFSREILLSHSIENLGWGTFLHFTKFLLSENIMDKRVGGRKEYHDNLSVFFWLTIPKNFVGEPFYFIQVFWDRNNLWIRGGE